MFMFRFLGQISQPIFDVAKRSGTFYWLNGGEQFYTVKQDMIFDNSGQELTFYYEKGQITFLANT